jgi:cell wall-associated NlpC family hydrolase
VPYLIKFKLLCVVVIGLALSAAVAHAEPPSVGAVQSDASGLPALAERADGKTLTQRSLSAVGQAASKIGGALNTGAQAFGSGMQRVTGRAAALIEHAREAMGVPYRWGGTSAQSGFDCSGFVRAMVQETIGKLLPHHAADQAAVTQRIDKDELKPGDLVFFNTVRRRAYSHVGIYMGDGQFIHAPARGESVRIDSLSETYWQKHFEGARRVLFGDSFTDGSSFDAGLPGLPARQQAAALPDTMNKDGTDSASAADPAAETNVADANSSSGPPATDTNTSAASAAIATEPSVAESDSVQSPAPKRSSVVRPHTRKHAAIHKGGQRGKFKTGSKKQGSRHPGAGTSRKTHR